MYYTGLWMSCGAFKVNIPAITRKTKILSHDSYYPAKDMNWVRPNRRQALLFHLSCSQTSH
jgi:hypothetical protein